MATERNPVPTSAMYIAVGSRIITILVGPENQRQSFRVYQSLLEARSENFRNALKPDCCIEAKKGVIRFTEIDPEIFHLYLSFAYDAKEAENYTERIMQGDAPADFAAIHEWFDPRATKLAKVFVLAHMLLDNDKMKEVFGQIRKLSDADFSFDGKIQAAVFPVEGVIALYENVPDTTEGDDPRIIIYSRYNTLGGRLGGFLRDLVFDLYEDRPTYDQWECLQMVAYANDERIKELKAAIKMLKTLDAQLGGRL